MLKNWIRIIHVAKRETGIDDEAYRAILSSVNVDSSAEIEDVHQFNEVMSAFKKLGFRYAPGKGKARGNKHTLTTEKAPGMITQEQEYYIRGLWSLASRAKDEKSLRAMILRVGKCADISFLRRDKASGVILALRDICRRAGLDPDSTPAEQEPKMPKQRPGAYFPMIDL